MAVGRERRRRWRPRRPPPGGRRSFRPRYPAWLTAPSLLYYAIFFLGPMAILVAFSLATQTGLRRVSYGFDTSQYHLVIDPLYLTIFERTLVMAGRRLAAHDRWSATRSPTGWRAT